MFMIGIVISVVGVLMIHTNLYNFEKEKKIKMIAIAMTVVWIITFCIILIASGGIGQVSKEYKQTANMTSLLLFAPLNTAICLPYLAHVINQYKQKRYNQEQVKKRMILAGICIFFFLIFECSYIQSFEIGLFNSVK